MSSPSKSAATVFYWPSERAGGRGVGHVSVMLSDGTYVSHVPEKGGYKENRNTRTDIPGLEGRSIIVQRCSSTRNRQFSDDQALFGNSPQSLVLPSVFVELFMSQFAAGRMLATSPGSPPLHGPLPYYQLADTVKDGDPDRSQCTTTSARMIAAGLPLKYQDIAKRLLAEFQPDSFWKTLNQVCSSLGA